jgi:hypothetical protein
MVLTFRPAGGRGRQGATCRDADDQNSVTRRGPPNRLAQQGCSRACMAKRLLPLVSQLRSALHDCCSVKAVALLALTVVLIDQRQSPLQIVQQQGRCRAVVKNQLSQ